MIPANCWTRFSTPLKNPGRSPASLQKLLLSCNIQQAVRIEIIQTSTLKRSGLREAPLSLISQSSLGAAAGQLHGTMPRCQAVTLNYCQKSELLKPTTSSYPVQPDHILTCEFQVWMKYIFKLLAIDRCTTSTCQLEDRKPVGQSHILPHNKNYGPGPKDWSTGKENQ